MSSTSRPDDPASKAGSYYHVHCQDPERRRRLLREAFHVRARGPGHRYVNRDPDDALEGVRHGPPRGEIEGPRGGQRLHRSPLEADDAQQQSHS